MWNAGRRQRLRFINTYRHTHLLKWRFVLDTLHTAGADALLLISRCVNAQNNLGRQCLKTVNTLQEYYSVTIIMCDRNIFLCLCDGDGHSWKLYVYSLYVHLYCSCKRRSQEDLNGNWNGNLEQTLTFTQG